MECMSIFLTTNRLVIKAPSMTDFDDQFLLQSDPEVMKYVGTGPRCEEKVKKVLQKSIDHYVKHGFSLGSVFEKSSNEFIGRAGLMYVDYDDTQPEVEIGYALLKQYWGRGYATEIAKALITWGFSNLNVTKLVGIARTENISSCQVLEKAGMALKKHVPYNKHDALQYEIEKIKYLYEYNKVNFINEANLRTIVRNHAINS